MGENTITATASPSSDTVDEQTDKTFFTDFDSSVKRKEDSWNSGIMKLISPVKLKASHVE